MKSFLYPEDLGNLQEALKEASEVKKNHYAFENLGKHRTALEKATEADLSQLDSGLMPEAMDKYYGIRYPSQHTESRYESRHERNCARREPRCLETRDGTWSYHGRR